MKAQPLTLNQLIDALIVIREQQPLWADRPVHVMDFRDDYEYVGDGLDGLVTHVETDCFDEQQGPVTSIMSWPEFHEFMARPPTSGED